MRADAQGEETLFTFLPAAGVSPRSLSFESLQRRSGIIARHLEERGLRGEPVLLLFPAGLEFIEAFFGCLRAGVVAVPAFPPRANRTLGRLIGMAADSGARAALTTAALVERSRAIASEDPALRGLEWIATDEMAAGTDDAARPPERIDPDALAYLQYTSGSTSDPKGVMVTHANVMANSDSIRRGFEHGHDSRSLSWLPHFHDMGLIDGIVQPVYSGFPATLMDPVSFLKSPGRWLEEISRRGITHSGAPNFAYDLCARRAEPDPSRIDLRSWAVAYNGAEPVRPETLDRFAARFASCGFRREAFYPAYGLAEATLKVSGGRRGAGPATLRVERSTLEAGRVAADPEGALLVGAGGPGRATEIRIVETDADRPAAEGGVGEIWVRGPGVARGYWKRPAETQAVFGALLPGDPSPWLRTGDLGFIHDGEIFVTGRAKDLVIVRGRNLYPQDVEATAAACSTSLRPGAGAAFGVEIAGSDDEKLVVVQELERAFDGDPDRLLAAIRSAIVETHEVDPHAIVLVRRSGVPRTSSGKVRRSACRSAWREGSLPVVAGWVAPAPVAAARDAGAPDGIREWLEARIAAKLGAPAGAIALDQPLARFGLDSLRSIELAHEIESRFGVAVPAPDLLAATSVADLARRILAGSARPDPFAGAAGGGSPADRPSEVEAGTPPAGRPDEDPGHGIEDAPLSAGQAALWFLHNLQPSSAAYTIASALRLTGPLDERALERALRAVVSRHASLRARISGDAAAPRQRFDVGFERIFSRVDLRGVRAADLPARLADEAYRPFDLEAGPLFRASLIATGDGPILLISAHHAIADLWSLSIVLRDLQAFHAAETGGPAPSLLPAPHPAAFVEWQRDLVNGEEGARQLAYWRDRLSGELPAIDLPADRPRPPAQAFRGGVRTFAIDPALEASLRELARSRGVTLYALLLAACQALLGRMAGLDDILVGTPAAGRTSSRFSGLVAYVVNPIVLRGDLSGDPRFEDLAAAAQEGLLPALRSQDYPFPEIVRKLAPRREAGRSPGFDVVFELRAAGDLVRGDLAAASRSARVDMGGGVVAEPVGIERRASQFDLSVSVTDDGAALEVELEYDAALFDAETIDRLGAHFRALLAGAAADPSARVSRLPLLTPEERRAALAPAAAPGSEAGFVPIHRLVETQAAIRPEAPAAILHGESLAYGDLDRRSNDLARRLRALGAGPEVPVAVCLGKSLDLLVAILAVLKSGGVHVPIDPSLPPARRDLLAADCGASIAVTRDAGIGRLEVGSLRPGTAGSAAGREDPAGAAGTSGPLSVDASPLEGDPAPGNAAYIIYTSGTTGTPKGVAVTHANIAGAFRAWDRAYDLGATRIHLQMAGPGFDVFMGDFTRALCSGGTLVLCDRDTLLDPPAFADLIRAHRPHFGDFLPATLRELAAHLSRTGGRLDTFRVACIGSDAWSMADYPVFRAAFGESTTILNSYGVTEATVDSTFGAVEPADSGRAAPPIGKPMENTSAHVLDDHLEPTPPGVRGELYLGGPAVARGYVARPGLTAGRFVPDPCGAPGSRMYRTGDGARRLADGRIEFLGRADTQVKIRGYRVEPGEIEAALGAHEEVRACAVAARENGPTRRLAAWVVPEPGRAPSAQSLREHLAARLPDYMIPAAFVTLDRLPLTENAKVDRRALPEPDWGGGLSETSSEPATQAERTLAGIWRRVLSLDRIGRDQNFFELGGDSILVIQVVARAREAGLAVSPAMLFEHPTVASLARAAGGAPAGEATSPDLSPAAGAGPVPLLPIQRWFLSRELEDPAHWNMAIALDAGRPIEIALARRAARAVIDHHDALRARFRREEGGWIQEIEPPGRGEPEIYRLSRRPGQDHEEVVAECARRLNEALDLRDGPVIRFGLAGAGPDGKSTLVFAAHHLVVDGVSLRLIVEDFERAYRQAAQGASILLPARSAGAGAWAAALEAAVREGRFQADLGHWMEMAAAPAASRPEWMPASGAAEESTVSETIALEADETSDLLRAAAASGHSVEQILLAALARSFARRAEGAPLYVEMESHGRDALPAIDVTRTVGWFTATWPLRIELAAEAGFDAALQSVALAPRPASGASFNALRYLASDPLVRGALARIPEPEISFNYLGRFEPSLPGSIFGNLREPASRQRSARARRTHALEIDASVTEGGLSMRFAFAGGAGAAEAVAALAAGCREALAGFAGSVSALRESVEAIHPVTPMQEGMLFHHLRGGTEDPYVGQIALDLEGDLDEERLARAWRVAVASHAALRTEFSWEAGGRPVQVVRREVDLPVALHEDGGASLDDVMRRARAGGFDMAHAPLARVDLVRTGARSLTCVFTHHHLLLDGWSLPFVLESVFGAVEALAAGRPLPEPAPEVMGRYAEWLSGRNEEADEAFFRARLAGFDTPSPAPGPAGGRPDPPERSGVLLAPALPGLRPRAGALGLTPGSVVQAALAFVVAGSSGLRDVVIGTTSSGRPAEVAGIETAVGLFINTLPLRVAIDPRARCRDWMLGVQRAGAELRRHEQAPLAAVQRCAPIAPNTPLFETLLVFENYPVDVAALRRREGFAVTGVRLHEETNYPLTIVAMDDGFRAIYDRTRFSEEGVRTVLRRLDAAIDALLSRPDALLGEIPLVAEDERRLVVERWNDTRRDYPRDATIHGIFEEVARRHPDRPAILFDGGSLSYGDLERRSRRIAAALRARGVRIETRVALAMERSPDLLAAILGVLRSGGAYLPLDADSPPSRTARTLADSRTALVVTDGRKALPEGPHTVVRIQDLVEEASDDVRLPALPLRPDNLAYVMFTSGSTGEPKGTEATHRNVLRLVLGSDYSVLGPDQTFLLLSSTAFDSSTFEIYGALLHGGGLAIAPQGAVSPAEIMELVDRFGVTILWLTTGLFHVVADEELDALARVGQVMTGGDVISPQRLQRLVDAGCSRAVAAYGPTETVTFATCDVLRPGDSVGDRVSIGRPIANTRIHLLDGELRPVGAGAPGDLYIGGEGVSRGYTSRPGLTAERFVPDPFGPPGARLYRTGDVASWRPDGRLDFHGRRDGQAKIRGFRVETGEVETVLAALEGVRAAAVKIWRENGEAELAGYVVAEKPGELDAPAVRQALLKRIPKYMLPARFVFLDSLPLNASGKVDRRALPRPGREPVRRGPARAMTPAEESIAAIWRLVLRIREVGPEDDFFEIGGHSLHATRVIARLRSGLGVELPLRALFEEPTIAGLARRVEAARRAAAPPLARAPESERRRCSYAQRRLWFLDRLEPGSSAYNIASAIRLEGDLRVDALAGALGEVVRRHESLRTRFAEEAGGPVQIIDPPFEVDLTPEDLGALPPERREAEAAAIAARTAGEPFDLERGPLLRARLVRLGPAEHVLALAMHHVAADGWSIGILVDELAAAYAALARGERPQLVDLPVQYADWAAWQRAWLEAGEMERQLDHWRAELDGLEPLSLPTDHSRPARPTYAGASLDVRLGAELAGRIGALARAEGLTLHMALLAAFAAVLGRWSGQRDVGIGTPVANRTREEAEPLIGCFVNTLVLRARLGGGRLPGRELFRRIREAALGAYANQDVPFERVVEELQPDRDLTRTPLFQVMFILQNAPAGKLDLGDLGLRPFDVPADTSTFDLTVSLEPEGSLGAGSPEAESGALEGKIEYSTELFEAATIRRLWDHFVRLLAAVAGDPAMDVLRVPLADPAGRALALDRWSGRADLVGPGDLVHERFAARAARHPERIAAVLGDRKVTYGEIRERAGRLASLLARRGVGPEHRVGLCVDRSPEMLVGLMAILEAGGAFVPMDPDHPRDRLAWALADSGARLVLATRRSLPALEGASCEAILLDDESAFQLPATVHRRPSPESLAYVIYTSGTTGRPKGVMVPHGALAAAVEAWERLYGLGEVEAHLQMAGLAFDVCTGDVSRALCSGGRLVFCDRETLLDPARLVALARREAVGFAEFVPAVLRNVAAHARRHGERIESLRVAAVGSDIWATAEIEAFRAAFGPSTRIANSYGVTEATIDSACWFESDGGGRGASPPIGRPLAHSTVYVLDDGLEPAPPGVIGELYLGGHGVARGYSGRPGQTADRFVPDPFGPPGARLYRTGDRARYLPDGQVVFAGRSDDQIKIRGQRIEPAEIESALLERDAVAACAVVARRTGDGVTLLAAYVVPRDPSAFDPDGLRRELRSRLPDAMIPSAIVALDRLPLTPNGKVDRRRLPDPDWSAQREYEPPATAEEQAVAAAFAEVLGLPRVGALDDFFALGGHSLLATQVISRLRASLGVELPVRAIFEDPAVRALAARAGELSSAAAPPPVRPAAGAERRRLSYAQQRLWFLDRLEAGTPWYNLPSSIQLEGDLDVAALRGALSDVVRRHEALRTSFPEGERGPEQVIGEPFEVALDVTDLSGLPAAERKAEADRIAREEARRPFDLAAGPLLRARLIRHDRQSHTLLVTVHHIVADGWSLVVLVRELGAFYGERAGGGKAGLEPLRVQYADWSAWQRAWLEGGEMERQLDWWRGELAGCGTLAIPSDRQRPARPSYSGASFDVRFGTALAAKLDALARAEGATLHMALLAGVSAALGRWAGQSDFAVGTPIANRRTAEAEPLIGFFVNTLAIRARLGGRDLTFRGLLGRIRSAALGAHAAQDVPFERVVEALRPERYLGHNPLFQLLFALQNVPVGEISMPGVRFVYDEPETGICRFDLELFLAETASGLEGLVNYSTDLFDRPAVERFIENLEALLEAAVADPDRPLAGLPAMSAGQLRQVLQAWNAPVRAWPDPPVVHALFEDHAARSPEKTAARHGAERISYGDLNARANRLARHLRRRGIGVEDLVAVCVGRSFDMLAALLAIMKAGAAYVPVDPEYPPERIALILADAGAKALLTDGGSAHRLPVTETPVIRFDAIAEEISGEDPSDLRLAVHPDALVYSVYTSGSTGRPKGVAMTHRAISNLLSWQRRDSAAGDGAPPRTLQFASLSFDVSFQEIFSTLTAGGEIVLVDEEERRDAARLLRIVAGAEVGRLFLPFVALGQLAEAARDEGIHPPCLREVNTAGEQLRITPAIAELFSRLPGGRLVNHYGPSETHLVTTFRLGGEAASWPELPPIGRPIENAPVYLLDAEARPVPPGASGEVYVGGAGLARGYHRRPDLTAERFVPDPFSREPGARLYRTGDLARFRADGALEFLGRSDLQVKIRGYRVEPGEIESALERHPAVRQAAVRAHEHGGGRRLAGYVVFDPGEQASPADLRGHLGRSLPEYMVPAAIVVMDSLPLTPNGKVDRGALPEPDWGELAGRSAPRTPEEEIVCGILAEVLGLDTVGPLDDFFEMGGHSLLATQVISRVRKAFGAEVPLRALFETPTAAGIAAAAAALRGTGAPAPPPLRPAAPAARRALSFAQQRLWFIDRLEPDRSVYNLPAALKLDGELDAGALGRALAAILRRHEALRTRFVEGPEGPEQIVDPPPDAGLPVEDLSELSDPAEEARRICAEEAHRPFDLARGPVLRARLLRTGPREHLLCLVAHHIAADGWSMGILVREIGALYTAFSRGEENPLPDLPVQYADWAAWQRDWLGGGELDRQLAWWRSELEDAPPALDLASDRARPAVATGRGATIDVRLPGGLGERLSALARREGATLHMLLLAAYAWTMMRHTGRSDVVVGTPVANRRAAEAEDLAGFFVNTLPVRVRGDGAETTFRGLIARAREASLGAYANQDVPFERVVEEIRPERALNRAPIFQTAFALQNARLPAVEMPGLRMTPLPIDTDTAKFDLFLTLEEEPGGLAGAIEYSTDLYDRPTIDRVFRSFASILEWAVENPDAPLVRAPLLRGEEEREILEWSRAGGAAPAEGLVHAPFERQAALAPDAPALAGPDGTISYGRLEEEANRLAHHLRARGAAPDRAVAILLERSPRAILAMLGVLKAGAAYLPLDPDDPPERLRYLLEDGKAGIVVTESRLAGALDGTGADVVTLDGDAAGIARASAAPPPATARPTNLAYVIYTSGSTGRPKGVGVEHRQIAAYAAAAIERLGVRPGWRWALMSTLAADLGNTAIFGALGTGGCLHVLPREMVFDSAAVESYFDAHAIDSIKIVPSHLAALMSGAHPQKVLPRRLLVLGGEATPGERLEMLHEMRPECRVANHYGPTEATVGAVAGFPDPADFVRASAPLGRPIAGGRAYILDDRGRLLPEGVPGELWLGGAGVTRGYLGRPGLTAERFAPDPFSGRAGARMYRTGDRARWLRDGRLEFLGRRDGQIKIRGFRVETGEIESAILAQPDVAAAAVVVREGGAGEARLVAYVVPEPRRAPVLGGLARRRLPAGVAVAELNRNETDYIHREVFELGAYLRHGVTLRDGDTVLDAGANIGLFTVFASLACAAPRIVAFEPNPHLLPILKANAAAYAPGAEILDVGLAETERISPFTFFPGFSLLSGLYADAETEKQVVRSFIEGQARAGVEGAEALSREAEALLAMRFEGRTFDVRLRALSDVMAERAIERIHLLKVNVEKAELDLLRGIRDADWERIDQAVIEVDLAANLPPVTALLEAHGFDVIVDQDPLLERTDLRYVYAARRGSGRALSKGAPPPPIEPRREDPILTVEELKGRLEASLPGSMQPSAWVLMEALPLTLNGKLDRRRLPEPAAPEDRYVAPRGDLERAVAAIWAEALGVEKVGAQDNFFDLGGHSLLLTRVHARLRAELGADLTVVELFQFPTVAALAARLAGTPAEDAATESSRRRGTGRRDAARARARGPRGAAAESGT